MPQIVQTIKTDITADSTIENALVGTKLENVPTDAMAYAVSILASADSFDVTHKVEADTDVAVQSSIIGDTLRKPVDPDDFVGQFMVSGGTKLFLELSNSDSANDHETLHTFILEPVQ